MIHVTGLGLSLWRSADAGVVEELTSHDLKELEFLPAMFFIPPLRVLRRHEVSLSEHAVIRPVAGVTDELVSRRPSVPHPPVARAADV